MKVVFKESFARDLGRVRDRNLLARLKKLIEQAEGAEGSEAIPNLKKLKGGHGYYRIRVGDWRVGLIVEGSLLTFVRFLHRSEIYRYFP